MKLTVLIENTTAREDLICEHGLSLYLEAGGKRILFDAGQSDALIRNASALGIDLSAVDLAILSHGHYDHGGGMAAFLSINDHAPLYVHERAFGRHFSGPEREIGLSPSLSVHPRVIRTGDECALGPGLHLLTCNGSAPLYPLSNEHMLRQEGTERIPDLFFHEQYLLIEEEGKRILISGCSHKGVLNLLAWLQPDILIGGFHWKHLTGEGESARQLTRYAQLLKQFPTQLYTCHCTGVAAYQYLKPLLGAQLSYLSTGTTIEL